MEAAVVHWTGDLSGDDGESAYACELSAKPVTMSMISVLCEKASVFEVLDSLSLVAAESASTLLFCDYDKCHEMSFFDRTVPLHL